MNITKSVTSEFDTKKYRDALGHFATGVCLITTRDSEGRARAMTANSFTSVSLTPPMILWCIDISSERFELFSSTETFSVSVLREDQVHMSKECARNVMAELSGDDLIVGDTGVPRYSDALAWFDCKTAWRQKAGDHVVIIANVTAFGAEEGAALGFFRGGYVPVEAKKG